MIKKFWMGVVKNRCGQSGHRTKIDCISIMNRWNELNWSFTCWCCKFRKAKSYFSNYWVVIVKIWAWRFCPFNPKICCILRKFMNWFWLWADLPKCFLGIGSLDFSEFWHGPRNPYEAVWDRGKFFGKFFFGKWFPLSLF